MSYYSPQARNGANLPHRVSFANFAEGERIQGKLSDFKTDATRHLWRDTEPELIKTSRKPPKAKSEHCRFIPEQVNEDIYLKLDDAVKIIGGSVATIRIWIREKKIVDVKTQQRNGGYTWLVNMRELTAFVRKKRTFENDINGKSWRARNREKYREYCLSYYHKKKKLKMIQGVESENT